MTFYLRLITDLPPIFVGKRSVVKHLRCEIRENVAASQDL
jgi:hypothetical protein